MVTVISNGPISGSSYHHHQHLAQPRALLTTPPAYLSLHHHQHHHHQQFPNAPSFASSASTLCCLMCSSPITFHVGLGQNPHHPQIQQQQHPFPSNNHNHNHPPRPFLPNNSVTTVPLLACIPCGRWCDNNVSARRNDWLSATSSLLWPNQLFIRKNDDDVALNLIGDCGAL
ncbi:unnamed protein product [Orchesella dallaii]|uniref:Uncharacterized protein n=1 Tax=Orchesella dallaii TaxID=48710 RepID=A0ABP1S933_9HEXA